jgi:hypothetical protein
MQASTVKNAVLAMLLASALPLAGCGDTPTSPSQSSMTLQGVVSRMSRSGPSGLNVVFRVGDEVFVRGDSATTVLDGSITGNTSSVREGQRVTVDAQRRGDEVYARHVIIDSK